MCRLSSATEKEPMKPIRDSAGNVVGYENEPNPNRRELRSRSNGLLAYYDKNTNRTFDAKNRNAGAGDQTGKFIPHDE
jgi:hypothetical protein